MEMINFKETVANNDFVVENLPDPERVIEGLRDTGYDLNTAMADIIDNSIAANADIIRVTTNISPSNEITIYIADNGCGMDFETKNKIDISDISTTLITIILTFIPFIIYIKFFCSA